MFAQEELVAESVQVLVITTVIRFVDSAVKFDLNQLLSFDNQYYCWVPSILHIFVVLAANEELVALDAIPIIVIGTIAFGYFVWSSGIKHDFDASK